MCGDFVASGARIHFISVWNWKTGHLISEKVSINYPCFVFNSIKHFIKFSENYFSFDFVDEHHIMFTTLKEDNIFVYDLRPRDVDEIDRKQQQQKEEEIGTQSEAVRFQLALTPFTNDMTSRYIYFRRNALPTKQAQPTGGRASGGAPPFHADPRERLIMLRITIRLVDHSEEQYELHLPARALLDHFAAAGQPQRAEGGDSAVPWSAWCDSVCVTPRYQLPYMFQLQMLGYGMRAVSRPPDRDEGVIHINSYLPRSSRREAESAAEVREKGGWSGTQQAFRLPRELADKENLWSVLCEDALLCFEVRRCAFSAVLFLAFLTRTFLFLFCNRLIHG